MRIVGMARVDIVTRCHFLVVTSVASKQYDHFNEREYIPAKTINEQLKNQNELLNHLDFQ